MHDPFLVIGFLWIAISCKWWELMKCTNWCWNRSNAELVSRPSRRNFHLMLDKDMFVLLITNYFVFLTVYWGLKAEIYGFMVSRTTEKWSEVLSLNREIFRLSRMLLRFVIMLSIMVDGFLVVLMGKLTSGKKP